MSILSNTQEISELTILEKNIVNDLKEKISEKESLSISDLMLLIENTLKKVKSSEGSEVLEGLATDAIVKEITIFANDKISEDSLNNDKISENKLNNEIKYSILKLLFNLPVDIHPMENNYFNNELEKLKEDKYSEISKEEFRKIVLECCYALGPQAIYCADQDMKPIEEKILDAEREFLKDNSPEEIDTFYQGLRGIDEIVIERLKDSFRWRQGYIIDMVTGNYIPVGEKVFMLENPAPVLSFQTKKEPSEELRNSLGNPTFVQREAFLYAREYTYAAGLENHLSNVELYHKVKEAEKENNQEKLSLYKMAGYYKQTNTH